MTFAALFLALIATPNLDQSRSPVLLDFQADWCGPCQQMRPAIQQLVDNGYPVKEVNIDKSPDMAERYGVKAVPTFIVIDGAGNEIARTEGYQPVRQLASFYLKAKAQLKPERDEGVGVDRRIEQVRDVPGEAASTDDDEAPQELAGGGNPEPWKTVVRIKVKGNGSIGFGSGTIIHSTPEESIILTCAHVFKIDGRAPTRPSQFPLPIEIDLFDGVLHKQAGANEKKQVHFAESVKGEALDYDFDRDVGLIRIRPGRRLPASRVVPPSWKPQPQLKMTTVGCSEGHDATAWSTRILKPGVKLFQNSVYEGIECEFAPKQGRSGGGLYTEDGYLAGVCDFAEPQGNHGYYATPRSIYSILNRNKLTALYLPADKNGGALLADNRPARASSPALAPARRRSNPQSIARAQSPDAEDGKISIPPPSLLGIEDPVVAQNEAPRAASRSRGSKQAWVAVPGEGGERVGKIDRAEMMIAPDADNNTFDSSPAPSSPSTAFVPEARDPSTPSRFKGKWTPIRNPNANAAPMLSAAGER